MEPPVGDRLPIAIPKLIRALRPQLSREARKLVESTIEAERERGDRRVADALEFLLERQDAARAVLAEVEGRS